MTEGPYKLPEGWRWVRLGEVAAVRYGKANPKRPGNFPVIGSGGIYDFTQSALVSYPTVVVGRKGSAGEAILVNEPCWPSDTTFYLEWKGEISPTWVFYWFTLSKPSAEGTTATLPSVRREDIERHILPLPPLEEQRRIVARIEALMARVREARRLRQEAQKDADHLWQSVLAQTFPRPGSELPEGWRWVRLGEVFEIQQGASMSPKRRLGRNPKPFLRTRNVLWGSVDTSLVDEMDFTDEEVEKLRLQPGDLLVCEGGDVGRTAIWDGQLPTVLYQNHIHRLRAKDDSVEPRFIMCWMKAAYQVFLAYQGAESRTAIPNLSGRRLKEFLAPLPPLSRQRRIVAHLEAVQEKIKALKEAQAATEAELKRLEQAILEKAFQGEL